MNEPLVSILMVARDSARFVDAAILSARRQTLADIEIVFIDDGSTDGTLEIARSHAALDSRLRVLAGPQSGLSAVRNASLMEARARYGLILDSDDLLHPRHCELLLAGQRHGPEEVCATEICATNMIQFEEGRTDLRLRRFVADPAGQAARAIPLDEYLPSGMIGRSAASLGYLKPMFDMAFMRRHELVYDERLRIGEDFDLVLRALIAGGRYRYLPQATYYYRRHSNSTSHRIERRDVEGLLAAQRDYRPGAGDAFTGALAARHDNLEGTLRHLDAIAALKSGRLLQAWRTAGVHPEARRLTLQSLQEAFAKRVHLPTQAGRDERIIELEQDATVMDHLNAASLIPPADRPSSGYLPSNTAQRAGAAI